MPNNVLLHLKKQRFLYNGARGVIIGIEWSNNQTPISYPSIITWQNVDQCYNIHQDEQQLSWKRNSCQMQLLYSSLNEWDRKPHVLPLEVNWSSYLAKNTYWCPNRWSYRWTCWKCNRNRVTKWRINLHQSPLLLSISCQSLAISHDYLFLGIFWDCVFVLFPNSC